MPGGVEPFIVDGIAEQRRNPRIIHFAGALKPWLRTSYVPYSGTWWHFADISPLGNQIRTSFTAMRKVNHRLAHPRVALGRLAAGLRYGGPVPTLETI
jgi:lipopolysaccharide biosynthesis glycosyltransferase